MGRRNPEVDIANGNKRRVFHKRNIHKEQSNDRGYERSVNLSFEPQDRCLHLKSSSSLFCLARTVRRRSHRDELRREEQASDKKNARKEVGLNE